MQNKNIKFTLSDLQKIPCKDNGECLVNLEENCPDILCQYRRNDTGIQNMVTYEGQEVDMGGHIAEFKCPELIPTYSPMATPEQAKWRHLLHDLMIEEGFAPFYGEWWHFSYGDKEWAVFYQQPAAIYSPFW